MEEAGVIPRSRDDAEDRDLQGLAPLWPTVLSEGWGRLTRPIVMLAVIVKPWRSGLLVPFVQSFLPRSRETLPELNNFVPDLESS